MYLAGFEMTLDILYDAAYYGLTDEIKGVSESIILVILLLFLFYFLKGIADTKWNRCI